jgi:hypothetical protein
MNHILANINRYGSTLRIKGLGLRLFLINPNNTSMN